MSCEFKITHIDLEKIFRDEKFYFTYLAESSEDYELDICINVYDCFSLLVNSSKLSIVTNLNYYTSFDDISNSSWKYGFVLLISDNITGQILYKKKYFPHIKKNNAWLIGDSHTVNLPISEIEKIENFNLRKIGFESLSLNRFLNSDYIGFINQLSIQANDIIMFYLGEIDIRVTIHKHCENKKINLQEVFDSLMLKYLDCILDIKKIYSNRIYILSPNPPIKHYNKKGYLLGTLDERIWCQNQFKSFWNNHKDIATFIDWTLDYQDENGFMNPDFLIFGDHHINHFDSFITHINNNI